MSFFDYYISYSMIYTVLGYPGIQRTEEGLSRRDFVLSLLQHITEPVCKVMLLNHIQYFIYWWSSTFHFIPSCILPSIIGWHWEADDHAQGGKADIQGNPLDVSWCFVVGEAKGSQDGETLANGVEHAQGYSALALWARIVWLPRNNPILM